MASEVVSAPAAPELEADAAAALLHLAREAVVAAIRRRPPPGIDPAGLPPVLLTPAAAFVTLHERGEIRGCMGNLEFERPLWRNVLIAGTIVPLEDPRFMPVVESELSAIRIEVSVLAPPVELPGPEAFDARSQGIIVERSGGRALLLPQVAEELGRTRPPRSRRSAERPGSPATRGAERARGSSGSARSTSLSPGSPSERRTDPALERA